MKTHQSPVLCLCLYMQVPLQHHRRGVEPGCVVDGNRGGDGGCGRDGSGGRFVRVSICTALIDGTASPLSAPSGASTTSRLSLEAPCDNRCDIGGDGSSDGGSVGDESPARGARGAVGGRGRGGRGRGSPNLCAAALVHGRGCSASDGDAGDAAAGGAAAAASAFAAAAADTDAGADAAAGGGGGGDTALSLQHSLKRVATGRRSNAEAGDDNGLGLFADFHRRSGSADASGSAALEAAEASGASGGSSREDGGGCCTAWQHESRQQHGGGGFMVRAVSSGLLQVRATLPQNLPSLRPGCFFMGAGHNPRPADTPPTRHDQWAATTQAVRRSPQPAAATADFRAGFRANPKPQQFFA
eukprot:356198-Chlamydomonas_euryale.AAC.2